MGIFFPIWFHIQIAFTQLSKEKNHYKLKGKIYNTCVTKECQELTQNSKYYKKIPAKVKVLEALKIYYQNLSPENNKFLLQNLRFSFLTCMTLKSYTRRPTPLPCIFLWVRRGVPGLDFVFPKFYYRGVPATVFHSTLTLYFLSERKKKKK